MIFYYTNILMISFILRGIKKLHKQTEEILIFTIILVFEKILIFLNST